MYKEDLLTEARKLLDENGGLLNEGVNLSAEIKVLKKIADKSKYSRNKCPVCRGTNSVRETQGGVFGYEHVSGPCYACEVDGVKEKILEYLSKEEKRYKYLQKEIESIQSDIAALKRLAAKTKYSRAKCPHCKSDGFVTELQGGDYYQVGEKVKVVCQECEE